MRSIGIKPIHEYDEEMPELEITIEIEFLNYESEPILPGNDHFKDDHWGPERRLPEFNDLEINRQRNEYLDNIRSPINQWSKYNP